VSKSEDIDRSVAFPFSPRPLPSCPVLPSHFSLI